MNMKKGNETAKSHAEQAIDPWAEFDSIVSRSARSESRRNRKRKQGTTERLRQVIDDIWAAREHVRGLRRVGASAGPPERLRMLPDEIPPNREALRQLAHAIARTQGALEVEIAERSGDTRLRVESAVRSLDHAYTTAIRVYDSRTNWKQGEG